MGTGDGVAPPEGWGFEAWRHGDVCGEGDWGPGEDGPPLAGIGPGHLRLTFYYGGRVHEGTRGSLYEWVSASLRAAGAAAAGLWRYELRYGSGTRIDAFGLWGAMWKSMGPGRAAALARASSLGWEGGEEASVRVKGRELRCGISRERFAALSGRGVEYLGPAGMDWSGGLAADLLLALSDTWSPQLWRYVRGRDRLCGQVCERGGIAVGRSGDDMGLAAYLTSEEEGPMHDLLLRVAEVAPRLRPGLPSERRNEMFP